MSIPKFIEVLDHTGNEGVLINTDQILYITDNNPTTVIRMISGNIIISRTDYITLFEELQ